MPKDKKNQDQTPPLAQGLDGLIAQRREHLHQLSEYGELPYPNNIKGLFKIATINDEFATTSRETLADGEQHYRVIAGRIMAHRGNFLLLQESPETIDKLQIYIGRKADFWNTNPQLLKAIDTWDLGDIVAVGGVMRRSGKGDLYLNISIDPVTPRLVAKSIQPPPEKYHGLKDLEARSRHRYLDLTHNEESWQVFNRRIEILANLRQFFNGHEFKEVETPMLHSIPGGATAEPFVTFHNALHQKMYLRISPELYLKKLIVGGMSKIYEIGNSFRNEGVSPRHNPEFTMLECYQAYATHHDLMDLLNALFRHLLKPPYKLLYQEVEYDFSADSIDTHTFLELLVEHNPILSYTANDYEDVLKKDKVCTTLQKDLQKTNVTINKDWTNAKLLLELFEKTVEPKLMQPMFVVDYPAEISPLARPYDDRPWLAQRFELFMAGIEIANGFSELNNPSLQAERFRAQVQARHAGDEEAMYFDQEYIDALEHGMPPTAGAGIGIDRLVMLLCDRSSVRDIKLFPHMRQVAHPEHDSDTAS